METEAPVRRTPGEILWEVQTALKPTLLKLGIPRRRISDWWWIDRNLEKVAGKSAKVAAARKKVDDIRHRMRTLT